MLLLTVNIFINAKQLLLTVNNFIYIKWYSLAALYKDDIVVYNCDHNLAF